MYQTIGDTVSVLGIFQNSSFIPKKFKWNNRYYPVEKITSIHEIRDGQTVRKQYAVVSGVNLYLIEYDRDQETWKLLQVWYEG